MEPKAYVWILRGRLAVGERPGGGGRSHRRSRREGELAWWREQGVTAIVSAMRTRHGLREYGLEGFVVRWHPLTSPEAARSALADLVASARELLEEGRGGVLVHGDRAGEWVAALDAALRLGLRLASRPEEALADAEADGFPVGPLTRSLVAGQEFGVTV